MQNIKNSSVFPLLLSILLDQISEDVTQVLLRSQKKIDKKRIEGIAAFYAGGLANTLFRFLKNGDRVDEAIFLQVVSDFMIRIE